MRSLELQILEGEYDIHRYPPESAVPAPVYSANLFSITKTWDELSIVCDAGIIHNSEKSEYGWSCLKVLGPLDFAMTGVLAELSAVLAENGISIFAISTFDTDYILVRSERLEDAVESLRDAGYTL